MKTTHYLLWPLLSGLLCLGAAIYLMLDLNRRNRGSASMIDLSRAIRDGAREFLRRELAAAGVLILLIFLLLGFAGIQWPRFHLNWGVGLAFVLGAFFTTLAGLFGLATALRCNSRTAEAARLGGLGSALCLAISGGAVMGLGVVGFGLIGLSLVLLLFGLAGPYLFAYALGVSVVVMFIRLSGGIYTKGADIGSDYVTRTEAGFSENDARNAAVIADSVGDNIGGVVGIGSNLMASYLEAIIAAMAIALPLGVPAGGDVPALVMLPLLVAAAGGVASLIGIFYIRLYVGNNPQRGLMFAALLAGGLTLGGAWYLVRWLGGAADGGVPAAGDPRLGIFLSLALGLGAGVLISFLSEFYTSFRFRPVRRIAERSQFGTALAVLEGLSVGMKSSGLQTLLIAATVLLAWHQAAFFGVAMAACGMLTIVGIVVTLNAFGPIVDNAGGIAGLVRMDRSVRDIMENLHAVSNVTTAMGKGLANGSAALVALGLLIAFIKSVRLEPAAMAFNQPTVLAGLLLGAMFPFFLSSLLFRAVGTSASSVVEEVRRQLREIPGLREGKTRPDYARCTELATRRAVRGMLGPGVLVLAVPPALGLGLGPAALLGFLAGALVCAMALGFQMVNAGGAMDNAKKYIEEGYFGGKGSVAYKAATAGDAVGDSFKDTVGPALMIVIKVMCIVALLIAPLLK